MCQLCKLCVSLFASFSFSVSSLQGHCSNAHAKVIPVLTCFFCTHNDAQSRENEQWVSESEVCHEYRQHFCLCVCVSECVCLYTVFLWHSCCNKTSHVCWGCGHWTSSVEVVSVAKVVSIAEYRAIGSQLWGQGRAIDQKRDYREGAGFIHRQLCGTQCWWFGSPQQVKQGMPDCHTPTDWSRCHKAMVDRIQNVEKGLVTPLLTSLGVTRQWWTEFKMLQRVWSYKFLLGPAGGWG